MISCRPGRSLRGSTTGQWAAARGRRGPDTGQPARSLNQSLQQVNKPCRVADSAHCPHRISVTNFCHLFRNFPKFQDASTSTFHWNEEINKISLIRLPHSIKALVLARPESLLEFWGRRCRSVKLEVNYWSVRLFILDKKKFNKNGKFGMERLKEPLSWQLKESTAVPAAGFPVSILKIWTNLTRFFFHEQMAAL